MENNITTTTPAATVPTRNALKAVLIVILFFVTFLAGIGAFFLKQFVFERRNTAAFVNTFSFISVFGAGVFLATCLLDLMPESLECFEKAQEITKRFGNFPFPELCIAIGFLLVLIIEQIILYANEKRWIGASEFDQLLDHDDLSRNHSHTHESTTNRLNYNNELPEIDEVLDEERSTSNNVPAVTEELILPHKHSTVRVLLLVFALSLHAVFEGLSVGMIEDVMVLLQVFFALLIHKTIIGFSLGIRLVQSKLKTWTSVFCCIIFAGQIIIGGFTGIGVINVVSKGSRLTSDFVSGILQGIACGTFLYITCFEILPHELNNSSHRPVKVFFLLLGFSLIAAFIFIFPD